jgi:subtilisin family serine protease
MKISIIKVNPINFQILSAILFLISLTLINNLKAQDIDILNKLDPVLKPLISKHILNTAPPMTQTYRPGMFGAIIKVSGDPMSIESSGARVRSVIGDIVTADIPVNSLKRLAGLQNIVYIQAAREVQPALLDASVPDTGADQVWQSAPGYTGKGVIVGVIDAGIDWRHPDFKGKDGTTRILYIWDQIVQTPGQSPPYGGLRYGTEWTKAEIDSGQCREMDVTSHGTHIASTMAGDAQGRHEFNGMAPEAYIIVVKSSFDDASIVDAANYIFLKAEELGLPAVINMSFGSHWGPHDGTSLLDQAMDEFLSSPGRAIVASAGNDGGFPIHLGNSALRQSVGGNYPWAAVHPFVGARSIAIQSWYNPSRNLAVRLLLPENDNGDLGDLGMGWVSKDDYLEFTVSRGPLSGAEVIVDATWIAKPDLYPNFNGIYIHISDDGDLTIPIDDYIYAIEYDGAGVALDSYVIWRGGFTTDLPGSISTPSRSFLMGGDGNKTIISPSSANRVICAGSYVTKSEWIDSENRVRSEPIPIDGISIFSSLGPLLNGARKPDITAPGEMIIAAFSSDSWNRSRAIHRDGSHVSWRGTSMSSPHVAGAIALIFQQNPNLSASQVKSMLTRTATDRGSVGWDKAWGYGKLNVLKAMRIPAVPQNVRADVDGSIANLTWSSNRETDIAGYRIYSRAETQDSVLDLPISEIQTQLPGIQITISSAEGQTWLSVSAYNTAGNEGPGSREIAVRAELSGQDVTPPDIPSNLTAIPIDRALDLKWSPNSEYDLARYNIYYGTSSKNYDKKLSVGKNTEYRIRNLTNGKRIYAVITSVDTSGNESDRSNEVSAIPRLFTQPQLRYQSGWPITGQHDVYSSPNLYDIDNDGLLEVSIASKDGKVYLLRYDGRNFPGWPISTGLPSVSSSAIGDMDSDGDVEIVIGAGNMVYMWHHNGTEAQGWPIETGDTVMSSPSIGDIDGDGMMEVVIGSRDGKVYAYNGDGSMVGGFPILTRGNIQSSAAIGDIDGDSRAEVVIGSGDGSLYVFKSDGKIVNEWRMFADSELHTSPALGDIDADGSLEIVAASERGRVFAWHYDGKLLSGFPVNLNETVISSPILGDVDGDGRDLEIVIGTRYGTLYVLKSDGTNIDGFPISVMDIITASPALGDIDGDGKTEIILATGTGQSHIGLLYVFKNDGRKLSSVFPVYTEGNVCYSSPAIGDLDGDGDVEIVYGTCRMANGSGGRLHAWDLSNRLVKEHISWGGFHHDPANTGVADDISPPFFIISAIQNSALEKYINLYIISSERLAEIPDLKAEFIPEELDKDGYTHTIILTQTDATSNIYQSNLIADLSGSYRFTVSGTDLNGNTGSTSKTISILHKSSQPQERIVTPDDFALLPNYPNPFNPGTWIPYELPKPADVTLDIYDISGRLIRSIKLGYRDAGRYTDTDNAAYWDGTDELSQQAASGTYFCIFRAGEFEAVRKMILLK